MTATTRRNGLALGILAPLLAVGLYGVFRPGPQPGDEPEVVTAKLNSIPLSIGAWVGADRSVKDSTLRGAEAQAYLYRDYRNETTREVISVLVLYGEPAALGAHTPQVCYSAVGYNQCGATSKVTLTVGEASAKTELWRGQFERGRDRETVDVLWGWGANGVWSADENPRFTYASHRMIYKIYVQRVVSNDTGTETSTTPAFPSEFLRELNRVIRRSQ